MFLKRNLFLTNFCYKLSTTLIKRSLIKVKFEHYFLKNIAPLKFKYFKQGYGYDIFFVLILILSLASCGNHYDGLNRAIKESGDNTEEIVKVLEFFKDDSIKAEAAKFLITNMINKFSLDHRIFFNGKTYKPDDFIEHYKDSFKNIIPFVKFISPPPNYDLRTIDSKFLISNINLAFEVRERYWWCAGLDDRVFLETLLPHRVINEPIENWRQIYFEKYKYIADSVAAIETSLDSVVMFFNKLIKRDFIQEADRLGRSMYLSEINALGGGTFFHMAVDAAHVFRAIGLPVNVDVVPFHGRINGGHAYNSYTRENGETMYFSPYERAKDRDSWTAPLVLRSVFVNEGVQYEPGLLDVTAQYYPVFYDYIFKAHKDKDFCLAIFNRGKFHPLKRTDEMIKEGVTIVPNIMYYPVCSKGESLLFIGQPFYYTDDGIKHEVTNRKTHKKEIRALLTDGTNILSPQQGRKYELKLWTPDGWHKISETTAKDASLIFEDMDDEGLFLVEGESGIEKMQRPFIISDGKRIPF